jgi:hypothetical protein
MRNGFEPLDLAEIFATQLEMGSALSSVPLLVSRVAGIHFQKMRMQLLL